MKKEAANSLLEITELPRLGLGNFPTPLEEMRRLSDRLEGPSIYVKRDDLTGLAMGGNKVRKLDYVMIEAVRRKADYIITTCGIQSNWARQVTGYAVKLGMQVMLILRTAQFRHPPKVYDGNILLDALMGARIKFLHMKIDENPAEHLEQEAERLKGRGHNPFILHLEDAESPVALAAYAYAVRELNEQAKSMGFKIDHIFVACGGGATQAGLLLGVKLMRMETKVIGIDVGAFDRDTLLRTIKKSYMGAAKLLNVPETLHPSDLVIDESYAGPDYGIVTHQSLEAIRLLARTEALILDPVYTSKAMAGLVDMVRKKKFGRKENVVFLHTGGIPALFSYRSTLNKII